jgi:hypothetical protein
MISALLLAMLDATVDDAPAKNFIAKARFF